MNVIDIVIGGILGIPVLLAVVFLTFNDKLFTRKQDGLAYLTFKQFLIFYRIAPDTWECNYTNVTKKIYKYRENGHRYWVRDSKFYFAGIDYVRYSHWYKRRRKLEEKRRNGEKVNFIMEELLEAVRNDIEWSKKVEEERIKIELAKIQIEREQAEKELAEKRAMEW